MKYDPLQDGISKVELIDSMGSDLTVVNSARVSMDKESSWEECWYGSGYRLSDKDSRLINFLARNQHISPFFHPQIQFRIKMPIFVAREWFRHEVGFARNEVSRRYVSTEPEIYQPKYFRYAAEGVKQGSNPNPVHIDAMCEDGTVAKAGDLFPGDPYCREAQFTPDEVANLAVNWYNRAIKNGVAPEWARMYLPQNMYTEFVETASLAAYMRLINLRDTADAQKEIREYAKAISEHIKKMFPHSWAALTGENYD